MRLAGLTVRQTILIFQVYIDAKQGFDEMTIDDYLEGFVIGVLLAIIIFTLFHSIHALYLHYKCRQTEL